MAWFRFSLTSVLLFAVIVSGCGSPSSSKHDSDQSLVVTTLYDGARHFVADGYSLPVAGSTDDAGTLEFLVDGELVAETLVPGGEFFYELKNFGAADGSKTLTMRLRGESGEQTATIIKSKTELEAQAVTFLHKYGRRADNGFSMRWPDGPILMQVAEPSYAEVAAAALELVRAWSGLNIVLDPSGTLKLTKHVQSTAYQYSYKNQSFGITEAELSLGAGLLKPHNIAKLMLYGLGIEPVDPADAAFNQGVLDKTLDKNAAFYPYQQQALRIFYSYPVGHDAFLPPSSLGVRAVKAPEYPLNLVTNGTVLDLNLDVRGATQVEVVMDGQVVQSLATPKGDIYPLQLNSFGTEGQKEILVRARSNSAEVTSKISIEHNAKKVRELALSFIDSNLKLSSEKRIIRWPKKLLTVKNNYAPVQDALAAAIKFLNSRLDVKFELTTTEAADIQVYEDKDIDGKSTGGQSWSLSSLQMFSGVVHIEPNHAKSPAIVAHELGHVIGLSHINDGDTVNLNSLMTPIVTRIDLYPHQQLAINLFYSKDPGTSVTTLNTAALSF